MKKEKMIKIIKPIVFLTILALLLFIPGKIINPKWIQRLQLANGTNGVHIKIANEPENTLDVIVIGDSESYTTVSPMELWNKYGYTSYVAGQPGAYLSDALAVLETTFKTQKPKVVMLESNCLYRLENCEEKPENKISKYLYSKLPFVREHNAWKSPFMAKRSGYYKGFTVSGKVKPYSGGEYMKETQAAAKIDATNRQTFRMIKEYCKENGATLVLYSAPSPKNYNMKKVNALYKLAEEEQVLYVDLNSKVDELKINWKTDTRDKGDHLNAHGARKTSAYLADFLKANFELKDHRETELAEKWNSLLEKYKNHLKTL